MRTAVLAVAAILAASSTAHAGGGAAILIPPLEMDVGVGAPVGGGQAVVGPTEDMLIGIHWASLAWKPTHLEIGVGYISSTRGILPGYDAPIAHDVAPPSPPSAGTPFDNQLRLDGGYLELGRTLAGSTRHWRTWIAARGELLHGSYNNTGFAALGGALRIASEVYVCGAAGARGGAVVGTLAIGVYVEASHREIAPQLGADGLTSGVSLRVPFLFAGS